MKYLKQILLMFFTVLVLSCDKMPMNGDLDGMWQLVSEQLAGSNTIDDKKADRIYISFQLHTAQFDGRGIVNKYYSTFKHKNDSLQFINICTNSLNATKEDDNRLLTENEIIQNMSDWGFVCLNPSFKVVSLNSKHMVLRSEYSTLYFRKF